MLALEQALRRQPVGQAPPGVEGPLGRLEPEALDEDVAAAAIDLEALGDVPLVAAQRRHEAVLERDRDAGGRWSSSTRMRPTSSALPTAKPTRQPAMP